MLTYRKTKNGGDRTQYLNATARALLESLPSPIADNLNVFRAPRIKAWRQTFLGQKSAAMTQRYVEIQPDQERRASEALDQMAVPLTAWKKGTTVSPEKVARP